MLKFPNACSPNFFSLLLLTMDIFEETFNTPILTDELSEFRVWTSQNKETLEQELAL